MLTACAQTRYIAPSLSCSMKPRFTLWAATLACACSSLFLNAQAPGGFGCGTDQARARLLEADPTLRQQETEAENGLQAYLQAKAGLRDDADTIIYHIPIVFHVLYDPTTATDGHNVSDAQVYAALNELNTRYRKRNADTSQICCGFNAIAADARLQFDLPTKDPFGNPTNGIDRVTTQRSTLSGDFSKVSGWPRSNYMNIWVCNSIASAEVAGYAYYPSDAQDALGALRDGVMIEYTSLVSFALVHEIGHYLNLQHVWGNNNDAGVACGDDAVDDTPITKGYNLYCPGPVNNDICTPGVNENYQNYMDYSYCSVMYTAGQRDRMRATLNDDISGRNNLWQPANQAYTGINGNEVTSAPEPDFYTLTQFVCPGTQVQLKANVRRATANSWNWTFEGGTPATSTAENPFVSFDGPGTHNITLTAGNDYGTNSITKAQVITVGSNWSEVPGLLNEPFNSLNAYQTWPSLNYEDNSTYWGWVDNVGHFAPGCAKLNASQTYDQVQDIFSGNTFSDQDVLLTPVMDLSNVSNIQFSFWFAYKTQTNVAADITESLEISYSTDCGKSWLLKESLTGGELVTAGIGNAAYTPQAGDWRQVVLNMSSIVQHDHVRFRFRYKSGLYSNDLFLDDVSISGTVGITENAQAASMSLFPNPATGRVSITVDLGPASTGTLTILDMIGRIAYTQAVHQGEAKLDLDLARLSISSGVYMVRVENGFGQRTEKLVVR